MQNLMQTCCSILPSITDKMKHEVEKALVTGWCHVADWCNRACGSVTLSSFLIFFHRDSDMLGTFR
jgi:hypothetical protein